MKPRKTKKYYVMLIVIGLSFISVSYALWLSFYRQKKQNEITSNCFNVILENEVNDINLVNQFPITDSEGMSLTPYSFRIRNSCSIYTNVTISLESLLGTTLDSDFIKIQVNNETPVVLGTLTTTSTTITGSVEARIIKEDVFDGIESKDYALRIWMDKDVTLEDDVQDKVFVSKIIVKGEQGVRPVDATLAKLQVLNSNIKLNESMNSNAGTYHPMFLMVLMH